MNIKNLTINKFYPWLIFIAGILIFTLSIPSEFRADYTARFAVFTKNMFYHGPHFFNFLYNIPYPDYPATTTFFSYLCSLALGKISMFSIILPNIIVASLTLVFVYLIGALHSRKWGMYGVIFSLFTIEFYGYGGNLSPDMYIALLTTISFYLAYKKKSYLIPIMLILAFMCRGPIGLIIPCGVLFGFYLLNKDYKSLLLLSIGAIILLIICSTALLGAAYLEGGKSFMRQVISMQAGSRFSTISLSYIYPILKRYVISLPLAIITIILVIKKKNPDLLKYLIIWAGIVFVGLAIVTLQKPRYFLPMVPALSLICGYLFVTDSDDIWIARIKSIFTTICFLLPYLALISIILFYKHYHFFSISLLIIIALFITIIKLFYRNKSTLFIIMGLLTYIIVSIIFRNPLTINPYVNTNFMNQVQTINLPITFYKIEPDSADLPLMANAKYYSIPQFIQTEEQFNNNMVIITYKKYLPTIKNHIKIIAHMNIRHQQMTAFIINSQDYAKEAT